MLESNNLHDIAYENYTSRETLFAFGFLIFATLFIWIWVGIHNFHHGNIARSYEFTLHPAGNNPETEIFNEAAEEEIQKSTSHLRLKVISYKTQAGDTLAKIFHRYQISPDDAKKIMSLGHFVRPLKKINPDHPLQITMDSEHHVQKIAYPLSLNKEILIEKKGSQFKTKIEKPKVDSKIHFTQGVVSQSLFAAGKKAGLNDNMIYALMDSYAWNKDFSKNIHPGTHFSVIYNDYYIAGQKMKSGDVLAASFSRDGKTFKVVKYVDPKGHVAYYTPTGMDVKKRKKSFLKTPVHYRKISSTFSKSRYHPILHHARAHKGIDFAAPMGTPIQASGDGQVMMKSYYSGYGNVVIIKHGQRYTTLYGHMSHFAKGIDVGSYIKQGEVIGYVGRTGLATGPHLHYEVRVAGRPVNPAKVAVASNANSRIPKKYRRDFMRKSHVLLAKLGSYQKQG